MEDATSEYLQALKKISVSVFFGLLWTYRWIWASPPGNAPEKRALRVVVSGAVRCQLRAVAAVAVRSAAWPCKAEGGESAVRECERVRRELGDLAQSGASGRPLSGDWEATRPLLAEAQRVEQGAPGSRWLFAAARTALSAAPGSWRSVASQPVRAKVCFSTRRTCGGGGAWGRLSALRIFKRPPVRLIHDIVVVGAFGAGPDG